jgi:hypothetical protein
MLSRLGFLGYLGKLRLQTIVIPNDPFGPAQIARMGIKLPYFPSRYSYYRGAK